MRIHAEFFAGLAGGFFMPAKEAHTKEGGMYFTGLLLIYGLGRYISEQGVNNPVELGNNRREQQLQSHLGFALGLFAYACYKVVSDTNPDANLAYSNESTPTHHF